MHVTPGSPHSIADCLVGVHLTGLATTEHGVALDPVDARGSESGISCRSQKFGVSDERRVAACRGWLDLG